MAQHPITREDRRQAEEILDLLRNMDPIAAAQSAPRLSARLPAGVSHAVVEIAQHRQRAAESLRQEWDRFVEQRGRALRTDLREWQRAQQVARLRRESQQLQDFVTWVLLQQQIDMMRRMDDLQAAQRFSAAIQDDRVWPAAREHLRAALIQRTTDAFLDQQRAKAIAHGMDDTALRTFDAIRQALGADSLKTVIRDALAEARPAPAGQPQVAAAKPTASEKAAIARDAIETRLLAALDAGGAGLTPEQRTACHTIVRDAVGRYFEDNGLNGGIPTDEAALAVHAEGLRGIVLSELVQVAMDDDLAVDTEVYLSLVNAIEADINALNAPAADREAAIRQMIETHQARMEAAGLDPAGMTMEAMMASAGRSLYEGATRVMAADPAAVSEADRQMVTGLADAARREHEHALAAQPAPEPVQPEAPQPSAPCSLGDVLGRLHERRAALAHGAASSNTQDDPQPRPN